jgi:hypothetical protein
MCRFLLAAGALIVFSLLQLQPGFAADATSVVAKTAFPDAKQPQVAVDPQGRIYLVFGTGNSICMTTSDDMGKSFKQPIKIEDTGVLALGRRRGPRISATDKAIVVTAVVGEQGRGKDGNLLAWRSDDRGGTWQGPARINGVANSAREGLHHLAAAPEGTFYSVWLDLREKGTELYGARSSDGGRSWDHECLIYKSPDGSICQCCQPQVAFGPDNILHIMWRNELSGNRDMYLIDSKDGGRSFGKPAKLGRGTWPLDGCPMDGGGIACDRDGRVTTIWKRDSQIYRCFPGSPEISLGEGRQGWAATGPDGVCLIWQSGPTSRVLTLLPESSEPTELAAHGTNPVVACATSGKGPVFAAWEESDGPDRIQGIALHPGR